MNKPFKNIANLGKYFRLSNTPPLFVKGKNEILYDTNNKKFIDLACGSGTSILGYKNTNVIKSLKKTLDQGITHLGPHFLSKIHLKYLKELSSFFLKKYEIFNFATNGTEAVETALKVAFHHTKKKKILYFTGSYHGRTGYSLSSSDMKGKNKEFFTNNNQFIKCKFNNESDFINKFNKYKNDLAAVIIEPIQATSGFNFVDKKFLSHIKQIISKSNTLFIFDEVWTGFGKTGHNFAYEYFKVTPDIVILGKSIGGGLPLGVVAMKNKIKNSFPGAQSSTFQGNILSIQNSYFFLKELRNINYLKKIKELEDFFNFHRRNLIRYKFVNDFRGIGSMWGIEINNKYFKKKDMTNQIRSTLLHKGLLTWECGIDSNVIGLVPPVVISKINLNKSMNLIYEAFNELN